MKSEKKGIVPFIVLIVSFGLCVSSFQTILDLWKRWDIVRERKLELSHAVKENRLLEQKLAETKSDQYVEKVARNTLGLIKEGEAIVLLQGKGKGFRETDASTDKEVNWRKWWWLFF